MRHLAGALHRSDTEGSVDGSDDEVLSFDPPLSSFQPRAAGEFVVALGSEVLVCERDGGRWRTIATVHHVHSGIRFNEGKCDPTVGFQGGSMNMTTDEPDAAIYRVVGSGAVETLLGGFGWRTGSSGRPTRPRPT